MKLQTKIPLVKQSKNQIDYNYNVLLFGSCFSENIGKKLDYFKFQNLQNPFGILFHPKAIETLISNAIKNKAYSEEDVFLNNGQWHCFDAHSKLSNTSKEDLIFYLNSEIKLTSEAIQNSTHIIITLGTAWVYRDIKTDSIVANCHKVPQKQFSKELLSVQEITNSLKNILSLIKSINNDASVVFTVSPIRHTKDGFVENTQSKAHLITAIHQVINNKSFYFPSFEIMMDELRDYRFYNEDMIHPNQVAINYIWDKFKTVWVSDESLKTMKDVDVVQKGLQHKSFNPKSQVHQQFLQNLEAKINTLKSQFLHIEF
ncbi:GSCFA domain-containing protein [uncultured Algibacter sp.]|uniref:GSCFA domain-containing protein n=1 Tax=uncultured Algibacter sp. TaxID=298659 RepID=UPI0030EB4724|tara:strand:+ start:2052 stop:2996 length:945 start_codon:yes stop_codon:yes gene_type:complete